MSARAIDLKELKAIVDWLGVTDDVREFSLKFGDVELFASRNVQSAAPLVMQPPQPSAVQLQQPAAPTANAAPAPAPAPVAAAPVSAPAAAGELDLAADEVVIKAPMVGTFYGSPKPGAPSFVAVGDQVAPDSILCIVEVMKLMNNIEAGVTGRITKILIENEQAVEYGQPLMVIKREA